LFGSKRPKKTFEGKPADKADWFLAEALDTIYDPHGSGKVLKPKTILARSSDGNVRVQDVVRVYDSEGKDGISDLAWTSPLTEYIIEAYDAC
jgi:Uma2 family endonuclease